MKADDRGHLGQRFTDANGFIYPYAWAEAFDSKQVVGRCPVRLCPGLMQALPNHTNGKEIWYGAMCLDCGHEVASPLGRTLPRSSLHREMPDGAWEQRVQLLKEMKALAAGKAA